MDRLWAPWRVKYIRGTKDQKRADTFINMIKEKKDKKNYIFYRGKYSFAVLNIYPYNNGHVLVLPNRKVNDTSKLKREEREDLMDTIEYVKVLLNDVMSPQGFNIGINLGKAAGAGIPQHIHYHVVPRWKGDSNFMPVVGETKIVSQSLKDVYQRLCDAHKKRH